MRRVHAWLLQWLPPCTACRVDIAFLHNDAESISAVCRALYHCNYCHKDISNEVRIKCADCQDFDLCLDCFAVGVEVTPHKNTHRCVCVGQWLVSQDAEGGSCRLHGVQHMRQQAALGMVLSGAAGRVSNIEWRAGQQLEQSRYKG